MKEPIICQKRPSGTTDLYGSFQSNADWILFATKGRFKFKNTHLVHNKKAGVIPNIGRKPVPEYKQRLPACWFGAEYPWSTVNPSFQAKHGIHHATIKSIEFIKWLILLSTGENEIVIDPFLGSGTTALAAIETGRHYFCSEIDTNYFSLAKKRIQEETI